MKKQYFFLSGLPRSGSTLLAGIMSQHKDVYVSGTSGISNILVNIRNCWNDIPEFLSMGPLCERRKVSTMRAVLDGFYEDVEKPNVIDKCRQWPGHLELLESILNYKPKIIVTVRDVRDILASFEKLWREQKRKNLLVDYEKTNPVEYQTIDGRCRVLMDRGGVIGAPVAAVCDAVTRGWKGQMLFVDYNDLCQHPKKTMNLVCEFIGIDGEFDFSNVSKSAFEDDAYYKWGDLHTIRPAVLPQESQWPHILPTHVAMQYTQDAKFWRSL